MILALAVFAKLVLAWRWRWIAALATLVLIVAIGIHSGPFRKVDLDPEQPLDAFTAGRTALWRQALEHPPKRLWLGVGLGNGRYATEILHFELGGVHTQVQHLHNFLMDVWYETGILGAGSLLALIGAVFWRLSSVGAFCRFETGSEPECCWRPPWRFWGRLCSVFRIPRAISLIYLFVLGP